MSNSSSNDNNILKFNSSATEIELKGENKVSSFFKIEITFWLIFSPATSGPQFAPPNGGVGGG